jgi:hypothetical protein
MKHVNLSAPLKKDLSICESRNQPYKHADRSVLQPQARHFFKQPTTCQLELARTLAGIIQAQCDSGLFTFGFKLLKSAVVENVVSALGTNKHQPVPKQGRVDARQSVCGTGRRRLSHAP